MKVLGLFALVCSLVLPGCASVKHEETNTFVGKVVNVRYFVGQESELNPAGALAGAVAGGVLGNQVGKGNGKKAMTVLGVVGGAMMGSQVGKRIVDVNMTELTVQLQNNSTFNISVKDSGFVVGQRVVIIVKPDGKGEVRAM